MINDEKQINQEIEQVGLKLADLLRKRERMLSDRYPNGIPVELLGFSDNREIEQAIYGFLSHLEL